MGFVILFLLGGYKSRLLFAKIAMAIWCQVSGVRKHVQFFIDLKILHVHIIAIGHLVFPLILNPETLILKPDIGATVCQYARISVYKWS